MDEKCKVEDSNCHSLLQVLWIIADNELFDIKFNQYQAQADRVSTKISNIFSVDSTLQFPYPNLMNWDFISLKLLFQLEKKKELPKQNTM